MAYLIGNRNDGRANAGNEKHTPGPEAESVSHVPRGATMTETFVWTNKNARYSYIR